MTFEQIVSIEPSIVYFMNGLRPGAERYFDYREAKRTLHLLVGMFCDNPHLQSTLAHDAVMRQVTDRLEI